MIDIRTPCEAASYQEQTNPYKCDNSCSRGPDARSPGRASPASEFVTDMGRRSLGNENDGHGIMTTVLCLSSCVLRMWYTSYTPPNTKIKDTFIEPKSDQTDTMIRAAKSSI